jgi:flagellar basal-body rod protein FlgB
MDLSQTQFFGLLRARLNQLSERQRLISENIANASTPGYRPRDLDTSSFERALAAAGASNDGLQMTRTAPNHMMPGGASGPAQANIVTHDDSDTTMDGNAVVLEDEMAKASDTRMQFETGIALYQKGLDLIRLASRAPGR